MLSLPIKTLWLSATTQLGGSELSNFALWQALAPQLGSVEVLFLDEPGPITKLYAGVGVTVEHLPLRMGSGPGSIVKLRSRLRAASPDLIHTHGLRAGLLARLLAPRGARLVHTQHNTGDRRRAWHVALERLTQRRVQRYVAVSDAVRRRLVDVVGLPAMKVQTIYGGIDPERFRQPPRGNLQRLAGVPAGTPLLLSVASFRLPRAQEWLIAALRDVPVHLALVGDGQRRAALAQAAAELGVADRVHFLGRRDDVPALLPDATVFVHATRAEGFGLAVLEAMAAGLPVVASDVGGLREVVQHGATGCLVPAGDMAALARALRELLDDPARRSAWGAAGRARAEACFHVRETAAAHLALYRAVTGR